MESHRRQALVPGQPAEPRPAATLVVLREAGDVRETGGFEVLMLRRSADLAFAPGAHVFPGGAVDPGDHSPLLDAYCVGRSDQDASKVLGVRSGGLAYYVAAIRECFEEAGLLLARPLPTSSPKYRRALIAGEVDLAQICLSENVALAVGDLHYLGRWITPEHAPRRFDTRFFVAVYRGDQEVSCDGHEVVSAEWLAPRDALRANQTGAIKLMPPTVENLRVLAQSGSVEEALARVAATEQPATTGRLAMGTRSSGD